MLLSLEKLILIHEPITDRHIQLLLVHTVDHQVSSVMILDGIRIRYPASIFLDEVLNIILVNKVILRQLLLQLFVDIQLQPLNLVKL